MTKNKFFPIYVPTISQLEINCVTEAIKSGWVSSLGAYIDEFESRFSQFCGVNHAVSVSNGTTALHLALETLGIGEGDEVIIPDLTFVATANAVTYTGAKPVVVDIQPESLAIDPIEIEKAITKNTKAIIPVHLYGCPAPMEEICKLAARCGIYVIEDCAEAHGAKVGGKMVGSFGDIGIFSFYGNKILTTGEGGMLVTNHGGINEKSRRLRDHAMSKKIRYWHEEVGFNYRMTNLQAALGVAQMQRAEEILEKKQRIFVDYQTQLNGVQGIRLNREVKWGRSVYWMVCIEIDGYDRKRRDKLIALLKEKGVDSRPYFYPISELPMYESANTPNAHVYSEIGLNLPSSYDLSTEDIECICQILRDCLRDNEN